MNHLERYLRKAPVSLALERAVEVRWYVSLPIREPVLDLGCGDGLFAERTYAAPLTVGIDYNPAELRVAARQGAYRSLCAADAAHLPFASGSFASVVSNSVLEHLGDLPGALAEVRRVLRPDGRFWFAVPSPLYGELLFYTKFLHGIGLHALADWYANLINVRLQRNTHCLGLEQWRQLLDAAGLRLVRHESYLPRRVMFVSDLGYPLAIPAKLWKLWFGRWILWPALRKPLAWLLAKLLAPAYNAPCADGAGAGWLIEAAPRT
jgi:SAM-dependent methyltransferase